MLVAAKISTSTTTCTMPALKRYLTVAAQYEKFVLSESKAPEKGKFDPNVPPCTGCGCFITNDVRALQCDRCKDADKWRMCRVSLHSSRSVQWTGGLHATCYHQHQRPRKQLQWKTTVVCIPSKFITVQAIFTHFSVSYTAALSVWPFSSIVSLAVSVQHRVAHAVCSLLSPTLMCKCIDTVR